MGIPKFFRWLSERYPLCSQLVAEYSVPEFDNFYLDMNGIIHNCARAIATGENPFTETEIFVAVFAYVQSLFETIKPKGTMFLAVDGVAPRAKCNQQRARRFRTVKEAAKEAAKELARGVKAKRTPDTDFDAITARFDSNCITPGTTFMHRLSEHMKYLIARRIEENVAWRQVQIIFSGADVPGEGEHKVMEYIRLCKAQPGYNPNMRHCLYGLDADLILLGLLSHEPHFALLREEVQFGKMKAVKKADDQRFYLLHLCLMREYMALEFSNGGTLTALPMLNDLEELALNEVEPEKHKYKHKYKHHQSQDGQLGGIPEPTTNVPVIELERFIDDFILLMCFVGNDFLPNLPDFHLGEGVLEHMFEAYKRALKRTGGQHINDNGNIQFFTLLVVMDELVDFERQRLIATNLGTVKPPNRQNLDNLACLARNLLETFIDCPGVQEWKSSDSVGSVHLKSKERQWLNKWASQFGWNFQLIDVPNSQTIVLLSKPALKAARNSTIKTTRDSAIIETVDDFTKEKVIDMVATRQEFLADLEELEQDDESFNRKFWQKSKNCYYESKFGFDPVANPQALHSLVEDYCRGLQWNMDYYYRGVASWSWFYPHYYTPMISDIVRYLESSVSSQKALNFADYSLDAPLRPLEQLMAVLPPASARLLPTCFAALMKDPQLIDFYPEDFETDANGKKASWEHIVKIPFIDTSILLPVMRQVEKGLSTEERIRNQFGQTATFYYDKSQNNGNIDPPPDSNLPTLTGTHTTVAIYSLPTVKSSDEFVAALCVGTRLGVHAMPGFPTLATLPVRGALEGGLGVQVFEQPARSKSLALMIEGGLLGFDCNGETSVVKVAERLVGRIVFINWPHLREAQVEFLTDGCCKYSKSNDDDDGQLRVEECPASSFDEFERAAEIITKEYRRRCAVLVGQIPVLVFVRPFIGMAMAADGSTKKQFDPHTLIPYALQTVIPEVLSVDERYVEQAAEPLSQAFPLGTPVIAVGDCCYGAKGIVTGHSSRGDGSGGGSNRDETKVNELVIVELTPRPVPTPSFPSRIAQESRDAEEWLAANELARQLGISPMLLSKFASSMTLFWEGEMVRAADIGLGLKSDAKALMSIGLARRSFYGRWEYSFRVREALLAIHKMYPELFSQLEKQLDKSGIDGRTIFPTASNRDELVMAIQPIKKISTEILGPVILASYGEFLSIEAIKSINASWKDYQSKKRPPVTKLESFSRAELLTATTANRRLLQYQRQKFELGQRVILVTESHFGQEGTIIGAEFGADGKTPDRLRVLLDEIVIGGGNLGGLVEEGRGMIVGRNECLNLNYIQPPIPHTSKAITGEGRKPTIPTSSTIVSASASTSSLPRSTTGIPSVMDRLKAAKTRSRDQTLAKNPIKPTSSLYTANMGPSNEGKLRSIPLATLFSQVSLSSGSANSDDLAAQNVPSSSSASTRSICYDTRNKTVSTSSTAAPSDAKGDEARNRALLTPSMHWRSSIVKSPK